MGIIIGIDGGGTKTRFAAYDLIEKKLAGNVVLEGTDYKQDGFDAVVERVKTGTRALLEACQPSRLEAVCFGMPGYSEAPAGDEEMARRLAEIFVQIPCFLYNDVDVALEGAFYGTQGILAVAGTGSLAYGRNKAGLVDRCGGWSEFFGDEGSGFWIGRQLLEIFSKQSDGRLEKSRLYELTRAYFGLQPDENDFQILTRAECNSGSRAATAALNMVVKQAADQGDRQARSIFDRAAGEIAGLICALRSKLNFQGITPVAVSGGLFHMDQYITRPMTEILQERFEVSVSKPRLGPCCGAIALAAEKIGGSGMALSVYEAMSEDDGCRGL